MNKLQEMLIQALQNQISTNHPNEVGLFPRLLMIISNLRELSMELRKVLSTMKSEPSWSEEVSGEIFGLID